MKCVFVAIVLLSSLNALILDIPLEQLNYKIQRLNGYDRIVLDRCSISPYAPGSPELSAFVCNYIIPKDQTVKQIKILHEEWEEIAGQYKIFPKQRETSLETTFVFTGPDLDVYNSTVLFPPSPVISFHCGNLRGYRVLQITVAPFRYVPKFSKLYLLKGLKIELLTEYRADGIAPKRQTSLSKKIYDNFLAGFVINNHLIDNSSFRPLYYVEDNEKDSLPCDLPSLLGPPVDLIIITNDDQVNNYESVARLKKYFGINTVVKTLSWVRRNYTGVDDAERIRNFIIDAYENWGISFVLLGGDTPIIPTRFIWVDRSVIYTKLLLPIASDLYYSDLDGNWNCDGDEKFGEVGDSIDLYPDVFVGRVPTSSSFQVDEYFNKVDSYVFPTNNIIQTKALFFSSNLDNNWPGLPYCLELAEHLPECFTTSFLDETLNNLTLQSLKDSLHSGFGIVTGVGHGDVNNIRIKFGWPKTSVTNFYFDSLTNTSLYSLMVVVTCYTNPFQADCLGEHWVMNPRGGGIAYVGPTSSSEGSLHKEYMKKLFDNVFDYSVGQALALAKVPYVGNAQFDNWHRVHQFSISLLGDPTLAIWSSSPRNFGTLIVNTDSLLVGADTFSFVYDPAVGPRIIEVILYKEGEVFIRDSTSNGIYQRCVKTESSGYLKYTLVADGYITEIDSVLVVPGAPYCVYDGYTVVDTLQNGNGVINPGEDIYLYIGLRNNGGVNAADVEAQIHCSDSLLTMVTDTASFGDIQIGEHVENITPFYFSMSDLMGDGYSLNFEIVVMYGGTMVSKDSFQIIGLAPELVHFTQRFNVAGDTVAIAPYIGNYGHCEADSVYGVLSTLSDTVVAIDSVVVFPLITPNSVVSSAPDSFRVYLQYPGSDVKYNFKVYHRSQLVTDCDIILAEPVAPDSLQTFGKKDAITLEWSKVSRAIGYRVYRAVASGGPYALLNHHLEAICYLEDNTAQPGGDYYYYISTVDSSKNQGVPSDTVSAKVNPMYAQGWPQTVYDFQYSSPNFGDIDPTYPGMEIVVGSHDGAIYAWHYDGSPVNGSDARLFEAGTEYIWSSPAIGDVDQDGLPEIVFGVMRNTDNLYVIKYDAVNNEALILPGWPKSLKGGGFVNSPVLADIDGDGNLEIFALSSFPGYLYAFNHDGSAVYRAKNGLLKALYGVARGTPAIGDINRDGELEIVCCGGSETDSLFVWDSRGNYLPPFPVAVEQNQEYSVIIGDIIDDSNLEICFYTGDPSYKLNLVDHNGNILWQHTLIANYIELCPAFGDVNNDGFPEVVLGYNDGFDLGLTVFDSLGNVLSGFPRKGHDAFPPIIVDASGDDLMDIIVGTTEWDIHAYDGSGAIVSGFPIRLGMRINSTPAAYDIDLDGKLELMVSCYDFKFHVFDLNSRFLDWPRFHYDPYNSGCYKSGFYALAENTEINKIGRFGLTIYPNPFNNRLEMRCQVAEGSKKENRSLKIYDVAGRLVKDLDIQLKIHDIRAPIIWYGEDNIGRKVANGVYFVRFESDSNTLLKKVVKIK